MMLIKKDMVNLSLIPNIFIFVRCIKKLIIYLVYKQMI